MQPSDPGSSEGEILQIISPSVLKPQAGGKKGNSGVSSKKRQSRKISADGPPDDVPTGPILPPGQIHEPFYQRPLYRRPLAPRVSKTQPLPKETADLVSLRAEDANRHLEAQIVAATPSPEAPATLTLQRTIFRKEFRRVGFMGDKRRLVVVIPSEEEVLLHNRRVEDWLYVDLLQMRKELIESNILKHGSTATDITVRTLYMAMKQIGHVRNSNLCTQWYNYHNDGNAVGDEIAATVKPLAWSPGTAPPIQVQVLLE